ncbi:MAG TPA: 3-deoxy-D-manno-octulosonic acid transferase [Candidatus Angelobacter sp.]|nr:3-deoxy-D-manno-octulosonic acid transferase [Candidatus Angelobacter sp.]
MMYVVYSLLLVCAAILSLPWWALQMLRLGKYRTGLAERLGFVPARLKRTKSQSIWVHAVSVGEVLAVSRLITELQNAYPEIEIFISTTTATGQRLARERFGEDRCFFMPLDLGFAVRAYLKTLQPRMLLLAETEFWPNLLHLARKQKIAIAVVNARISDRSFPRYRRFSWFFRRVLAHVDLFLTQTAADADRLRTIGAPTERVRVSGNLKFDVRPHAAAKLVEELRSAIAKDAPMIVCGSTAEGEEEILLDACQQVQRQFPATVMVLAPRHPERFNKVADLISSSRIAFLRRSLWIRGVQVSGGVFLLDSVGELASVYSLADIAFVGGSLAPTGGHNILEPAQYGAAIVVGPHTFNFREIVSIFEKGDAIRVVNPENIAHQFIDLLTNLTERGQLGGRAKQLFAQYAGATQKTLQALRPLLAERPSESR